MNNKSCKIKHCCDSEHFANYIMRILCYNQALPAFLYCKQQKAACMGRGRSGGQGTRLYNKNYYNGVTCRIISFSAPVCDLLHVLVIAWQQGLYARYWHCCDVKPEGRSFTSQQCQYLACSPCCRAITNLLHAPDWMLLRDVYCYVMMSQQCHMILAHLILFVGYHAIKDLHCMTL